MNLKTLRAFILSEFQLFIFSNNGENTIPSIQDFELNFY